MIYLNEFDPYAAAWLRELMAAGIIPKGHVDERSITEVTPDDLRGYSQCHFFAGIGMWPIALSLAGWPEDREVWTGSCPCQPFSSAGKQKGKADERHLLPVFHKLIDACQPSEVYGEQVADGSVVGTQLEAAFVTAVHAGDNVRANRIAIKIANHKSNRGFNPGELSSRWLTDLRRDMGGSGYSLRWEVLGAHSIGSPTIRQRLFWRGLRLPGTSSPRLAGTRSGAAPDRDGANSLPQRGHAFDEPAGRCEACRVSESRGVGECESRGVNATIAGGRATGQDPGIGGEHCGLSDAGHDERAARGKGRQHESETSIGELAGCHCTTSSGLPRTDLERCGETRRGDRHELKVRYKDGSEEWRPATQREWSATIK